MQLYHWLGFDSKTMSVRTELIAGATTDPPALAYANQTANNDAPAVGYSTVYPLCMFLRILTAQLIILLLYSIV